MVEAQQIQRMAQTLIQEDFCRGLILHDDRHIVQFFLEERREVIQSLSDELFKLGAVHPCQTPWRSMDHDQEADPPGSSVSRLLLADRDPSLESNLL
jgi:hypothetical protein